MFKKRVVKTNRAASSSSSKRPLDSDESQSDSDDAHNSETKTSSQEIKKRKPLNSIKRPNREVAHGQDSLNTLKKLSNPSMEHATLSGTSRSAGETAGGGDKAKGPVKPPPVSIKTTTITDFQPDVCKDFLQTGYCGYGDTCKFLHIRDELRQRRPIEKEWETVGVQPTDKTKDQVPYRCVLCKKDYVLPVKTACNHIFCQKCFMNRYKGLKKPNCFICGKDTGGVCSPVLKKELDSLLL